MKNKCDVIWVLHNIERIIDILLVDNDNHVVISLQVNYFYSIEIEFFHIFIPSMSNFITLSANHTTINKPIHNLIHIIHKCNSIYQQ